MESIKMQHNEFVSIRKFGRIDVSLNMLGIIFSGLVFPVLSLIFIPSL